MRNLFFVFVAANVVIFMYYFYVPDASNAPVAVLPANTEKLVLLSEVDKASLTSEPAEMVKLVVGAKQSAVKVRPKKCFTIGPFRQESEITEFKSRIAKKVKKVSVRQRVEKQHWRYWVYLKDAGSKAKAVKLAADLARKGLKDYYVIARGEFKNSISLGHFKDKSLAEKRFKAIKKMAYKPEMQAIEKEYTLFWLDYVAKKQHGFSNATLESFELDESIHQFNRECAK